MMARILERKVALSAGLLWLMLQAEAAQAYVDPGTGSYMFQVLLAAVFGALFAIKTKWSAIKSRLRRLFPVKPDDTR